VNADETGKGLPDFCWAIVIAARREQGRLHSLSVFAFGADEKRQDRVQDRVKEAVAAGTTEWHVHLLAQNEHERRAVLHDLKAQAL
jgi:hypothetical protein